MKLLSKRNFVRVTALILILALLPCASALAAEGTLAVKADKASVTAGDTLVVTFELSGAGLSVAQGTFDYDPALLAFVEGTGGASDGALVLASAKKGGESKLVATATFTALAEGEATISAAVQTCLDFDGSELDNKPEGNTKISIAAAPPAPAEPAKDYSQEGVAARNVQGTQTEMYIWKSLEDLTLPSGYADREIQYDGQAVPAAAIPDTEWPIVLYLSDAAGENKGYYIYDSARDILYPYNTVSSSSATYTLMKPEEGVTPPQGYVESTLEKKEKLLQVFVPENAGEENDIYLVYARNSEGELGFFRYNTTEGSIQRYGTGILEGAYTPAAAPTPTPAPEQDEPAKADDSVTLTKTQFYIACGVAGVLLITTIALTISRMAYNARKKRRQAERRAAKEAARKKELREAARKDAEYFALDPAERQSLAKEMTEAVVEEAPAQMASVEEVAEQENFEQEAPVKRKPLRSRTPRSKQATPEQATPEQATPEQAMPEPVQQPVKPAPVQPAPVQPAPVKPPVQTRPPIPPRAPDGRPNAVRRPAAPRQPQIPTEQNDKFDM